MLPSPGTDRVQRIGCRVQCLRQAHEQQPQHLHSVGVVGAGVGRLEAQVARASAPVRTAGCGTRGKTPTATQSGGR